PAMRTVTVESLSTVIPQTNFTFVFADSQETGAGDFKATNAFDGNPNTMWTSHWFDGPFPPHELQIDLGATYNVSGFRYLPGQLFSGGRVGDYEFYVSSNTTNWGTAAVVGAFPDTNSGSEVEVLFP